MRKVDGPMTQLKNSITLHTFTLYRMIVRWLRFAISVKAIQPQSPSCTKTLLWKLVE